MIDKGDIVGWITKGGRRIPIRAKKDTDAGSKYGYNSIRNNVKKLSSKKYADGTYDASTLDPIEYKNGYQVTYCQIGDKYTTAEHDELIKDFLRFTDDGKVSLGKFGGTPEHSFHFRSRKKAVEYAKKHNQVSIWDWENGEEIPTGGTGRRD